MKKTISELQKKHQKKILISMIAAYCAFWLCLIAASSYFQIEPGFSVVFLILVSLLFFNQESDSGYFWFQKKEQNCVLAARIVANELALQLPPFEFYTRDLECFLVNSTKLMLYCNKHLYREICSLLPLHLPLPSDSRYPRKFVLESFLVSEFLVRKRYESSRYEFAVSYALDALEFLSSSTSFGSSEYHPLQSSVLTQYQYINRHTPDHAVEAATKQLQDGSLDWIISCF